jgi:aquaporin TIP|eukprot:Tamp_15837.p2 GENE.Tamp_15837~~Tamp_15837.p2  ORF type:complete len:250 (+),score=63.15 Tamp_15837:38-751(+)
MSLLGKVPVYCVVAEFVGVFLFQFIGGGADANSISTGLATAAIGNGLAFVVLVYATAGISGGHLNPAISTAFVVTGRLGKQRYACYCVAQVLGAIFGALALKLALPPAMDETPFTTTGSLTFSHPFQVFFLEFVCTFTLVYCVFATAVDKSGAAKNAAPLAIGLAIIVGVFAEGPFTGGSMNPARTLGPAFAFGQFKHVWVYLLSTMAGGACAGLTYDKLFLEEIQPADSEDRDDEV